MSVTPCAYPEEFRRDVVEIARRDEPPIGQIAKDLLISDAVIRRWFAKVFEVRGSLVG